MNHQQLRQIRDASGLMNQLASQIEKCLTRSYPNVTLRGSQCEEDEILRELLPEDTGVYVDIGAAEPVQCSNTWAFHERGWRGLLVEPLFWYWPALLQQRVGDWLYPSAVRDYDGFTRLQVNGTVSSVIPGWNMAEQGSVMVPCETTASVLAKFPGLAGTCSLCSIDVEGAEREVLASIDWSVFHPEVFVVEYRKYDPHVLGDDISGEWESLLTDQGYAEVARTNMNLIFKRA